MDRLEQNGVLTIKFTKKRLNSALWKKLKKQKYIQAFVLVGMLFILIFNYIPMFGVLMAFKRYSISDGVMGIFTSEWVGLKHFKQFFNEMNFWMIIRNTVGISVFKLIFTFPIPIIFALMINEVSSLKIKKLIQTASYLPHFISWVVVSGLTFAFFSVDGGVVNQLLMFLQLVKEPLPVIYDPEYFWGLAIISDAWKEFGWWAIIFIASISGIDPTQYQAAQIDGAGRLARIWYVTLPGIRGAIGVVLILSIGNLLGGGLSGSNFEQAYLLGNAINNERSEIIQTYVLKVGLGQAQYSYATAIGLLQSTISVMLIFGSNFISKKVSNTALF